MKSKIKEEQLIEELQHASPVKTGKHFQSFFIDCVVVIILSYLLFLGANSIAMNSSAYKTAQEISTTEVEYYKDYISESRAMEYEIIDGERIRKDKLTDKHTGSSKFILENINRAIYYSIEYYGDFSKEYDLEISEENMELIKKSITPNGHAYDDTISFFYTNYILNSEYDFSVQFSSLEEAQEYVFDTYKRTFGEDAASMFLLDREKTPVPVMKTRTAYYLYYFLYVAEDSKIVETSEQYYMTFSNGYTNMQNNAEDIMVKGEPYYTDHYTVYYENNTIMSRYINIALIISIFIGYFLGVVIPKIIFKHGRSLCHMVFKLGEIDVDNQPVGVKSLIIKSIIGCFGYLSISFILYLFKPFSASFGVMMYPFIGNISLVVIIFIITFISLVNGCVMLFTSNHVGFGGLLSKTILVDRKYIDEYLTE